ncbi:MAG: GreA/GreB family elongation factor [Thermanaeromonas sp.]|uniref:GreA/GreB family elongation factor n=1 Tax=Thermanaeromonas sp. TaxID=2003697 RepID=UPI00243D92DF|nr:GreA/GreB family elongation factor [Thermanaeromonas sp.]MCG0279072.1 GreA/GreB family elongation factor [Thermanaeromonas sp.]
MDKVRLSPVIFENLIKHLVNIEEEKEKLLEQYFPRPSKERSDLEKLFDNYIRQVEQLIKNAIKSETTNTNLPIVIFGSEVEVENLDTGEISRFRIVSPFDIDVESGDISYLSPMGRSLLLKRTGDEVTVHAPAGVFRYKIKSIKFPSSPIDSKNTPSKT